MNNATFPFEDLRGNSKSHQKERMRQCARMQPDVKRVMSLQSVPMGAVIRVPDMWQPSVCPLAIVKENPDILLGKDYILLMAANGMHGALPFDTPVGVIGWPHEVPKFSGEPDPFGRRRASALARAEMDPIETDE